MSQKTTEGHPALPIKTMGGDSPISYPRASLRSLSAEARQLLRWGANGGRIDHNPLDKSRRIGFISQEDRAAFQPDEALLAVISELETAGMAQYDAKYRSFTTTLVHPEYTVAEGRGSQLIRVSTYSENPDYDKRLLAVIIGADLEERDSRRGEVTYDIRARHESATDFEHDASSTAWLTLSHPSNPVFGRYGRVELTAVLTEAHLYPLGTDPLEASDADTDSKEMCTSEHCSVPHPFAPFQPPVVASITTPTFVHIEMLPHRPYLVEDPAGITPHEAPASDTESETA